MTELISLIMPVKNEAKFITQTMDSILKQTYPHFELLIIDDHSTDQTATIIKTYLAKDDRIKYYVNKGTGVIEALQTGQKYITGEAVSQMDGDDLMPNDKLELFIKQLASSPMKTIVTGKVKYFSDDKLMKGFRTYERWLNEMCDRDSHWSEIYKECVIASPNWLMRRSEFEEIGGFSNLTYPEDYDFIFKVFEHKYNVESINHVTHFWRDHQNRASRILPQYQDQHYFELKLSYFKKLNPLDNLIVWGAGPTGKKLAKALKYLKIDFTWVSNSPRKVGETIYKIPIQSYELIKSLSHQQIIVAIAQTQVRDEIENFLDSNRSNTVYYFV